MKIVQNYILREFLVPLGYCLTGFVSIYVLFDLFGSLSRMLSAEITFKDAVLYMCGYLAPYFHYLVPAALMLATLYTMWAMCRHSELVALRASGISFLAIVRPLLGVAFVMAIVVLFVNEWFVPRYANWAVQFKAAKFVAEKMEKADNIVYRNSVSNRIWNVDTILKSDATELKNVRVAVDRANGGARLMRITADRASYLDGEWWFSGTHVQHYDMNGQEIATTTPELDALTFRAFVDFDERPEDFLLQNSPWRYNSIQERFRYLATHGELTAQAKNDRLYDTWAQIMAPWACLVITLFAIPAGIASGRQSVFKGIVGALLMFFSFYGVTIAGMVVAKNGQCPAILAAVFPHVLFLALGIRAFLKQR